MGLTLDILRSIALVWVISGVFQAANYYFNRKIKSPFTKSARIKMLQKVQELTKSERPEDHAAATRQMAKWLEDYEMNEKLEKGGPNERYIYNSKFVKIRRNPA